MLDWVLLGWLIAAAVLGLLSTTTSARTQLGFWVAVVVSTLLLIAAAPAHADDGRAEATVYAICQRLGAHPNVPTLHRIIEDLLTIGYEPSEVARLTTYGVARVCPENLPVVRRAYEGITA